MTQNYLIRLQQIGVCMDGEKRNKKTKQLSQFRGWISIYLIPSPAALELKNAIVLTLTVINSIMYTQFKK